MHDWADTSNWAVVNTCQVDGRPSLPDEAKSVGSCRTFSIHLSRPVPEAQRAMSSRAGSSAVEIEASHAVYMSQPAAVAALITQAAVRSVRVAG